MVIVCIEWSLIMWKNLTAIVFSFLLLGCGYDRDISLCPAVNISRNDAYLTKNNGVYAEIYGYDAYCFDDNTYRNQKKAVIIPQFRIARNNTESEQVIYLEYYIKIGNSVKTFEDSFTLLPGKNQMAFSGKKYEIKIKSFENHTPIHMGLVLSENERFYNQQTFDLGLEDDLAPINIRRPNVSPSKSCSSCNL